LIIGEGMKRTLLLLLIFSSCLSLFSQALVVEVSGIRSKSGVIRLALFTDQAGFKAEKPFLARSYEKIKLLDGKLTLQVDSIAPGMYGIALLDDENRDGRLDYRLILPKEGVGFSYYEQHGFHRPVFDDFSFSLKKNVTLRIPIRLTYY
jgi:uncharacterized protein (DUF2141 family)